MDTVVTVLSLFVALSVMVLVHELGHLIAAKRSGVVVEEFGIGYPPRLLTLWRGEGKVVIGGKEIVVPRKMALPKELRSGAQVRYATAQDEKGRSVLTRLEEVGEEEAPGGPAGEMGLLDRGTIYSVNAIPFGGFTKMLGEEDPTYPGSLASKNKRTRIVVLMAGAALNLVTAVLFFALAYGLGAPAAAEPENAVVKSVVAGAPAEAAGLRVDDVIVKADGTDILTVESLQAYVADHLGDTVVLTVQRGEETIEIALVPRVDPPEGQGPTGITLGPRTTVRKYPWYEAAWMGLKDTVSLSVFTLTVPVQLIRGLIPADQARPVGPVGVGQLVGDAVQYSLQSGWWFPVMLMMGSLSVAIAVTNLLPLPALDGGRILFVIIEAIRGRRIDPAKEGMVHLIGMALLLALMVLITWQDVVHPLQGLDWSSYF